jgi:hypothetical protein
MRSPSRAVSIVDLEAAQATVVLLVGQYGDGGSAAASAGVGQRSQLVDLGELAPQGTSRLRLGDNS